MAQAWEAGDPPPREDDPLGIEQSRAKPVRQRIKVYAEEDFGNVDLTRSVHLGWGATIGAAIIFFCMGASAVTQPRSWNVSFRWLQRRVGAQFGTMSYIITSNVLYYHDGDKWVTRDWGQIFAKLGKQRSGKSGMPAGSQDISRGFAADALGSSGAAVKGT